MIYIWQIPDRPIQTSWLARLGSTDLDTASKMKHDHLEYDVN